MFIVTLWQNRHLVTITSQYLYCPSSSSSFTRPHRHIHILLTRPLLLLTIMCPTQNQRKTIVFGALTQCDFLLFVVSASNKIRKSHCVCRALLFYSFPVISSASSFTLPRRHIHIILPLVHFFLASVFPTPTRTLLPFLFTNGHPVFLFLFRLFLLLLPLSFSSSPSLILIIPLIFVFLFFFLLFHLRFCTFFFFSDLM